MDAREVAGDGALAGLPVDPCPQSKVDAADGCEAGVPHWDGGVRDRDCPDEGAALPAFGVGGGGVALLGRGAFLASTSA